jgi:hypothetical protein
MYGWIFRNVEAGRQAADAFIQHYNETCCPEKPGLPAPVEARWSACPWG